MSGDTLYKWLRGDRIPTLEKISPIMDKLGKFTPDVLPPHNSMDKWEITAAQAWQAVLSKVESMRNEGKTLQQIADTVGVKNRSLIGEWLNGNREAANAPFPNLMSYLENLGIDYRKFFPDEEQEHAGIRRVAPHRPLEEADFADSVEISVYALADAGPVFEQKDGEALSTIRIPPDYAMRCDFAVLVKGDSMAWTIKNGGVVGIMRKNFDFISGEVYAVRLPYEGLSIKRVIVDASAGEYIIRSDNPDKEKYPDRRLPITEYDGIIMGRVVWVWQMV